MSRPSQPQNKPDTLPIHTDLDEESEEQLDELLGSIVLTMALWEEPLVTALGEEAQDLAGHLIDLDIYFEDHALLELYSALVFTDDTQPPLSSVNHIADTLARHVEKGIYLGEIAEEEETGAPIFIFHNRKDREVLLILADGWEVDTWDTLPSNA